MLISAVVRNDSSGHDARVRTDATAQSLAIAAKASGRGSAVNGGELLMLALATCYCNDLFREAQRLGIELETVEVEAAAEFPGIGVAARNVTYRAKIDSPASRGQIEQLLHETDAVAEIHNTLRVGASVTLQT